MITFDGVNLEYSYAGLFIQDKSWRHPKRQIDTYEIIFMRKGTAYISENGVKYTVGENDFLLLEPHKTHFGFKTSEPPVSFYWLHIHLSDPSYLSDIKTGSIAAPQQLVSLFSQVLHYSAESCMADLFSAAIVREIKSKIQNSGENMPVLAARIKEWLNASVSAGVTVKQTAQHFGYNENYIARFFKHAFGVGIKDYINSVKTDNAKNLLSTTMASVKEISAMLSFPNENAFVKYFKYHTGLTPSEYRNIYVNMHINKE